MSYCRRDFRPDKMIRKSHDGFTRWGMDSAGNSWTEEFKHTSDTRGFAARIHNRRQRAFNRREIDRQLRDGEE